MTENEMILERLSRLEAVVADLATAVDMPDEPRRSSEEMTEILLYPEYFSGDLAERMAGKKPWERIEIAREHG